MSSQLEYDKEVILHHPDLSLIYTKIRDLAQELVVLGKIDFASQITDLLLSQNRTEHGFSQMRKLNFAFEQTGDWPSVIPKPERNKRAVSKLEIPPTGPMDENKFNQLINETEVHQRDPALCLSIAVILCEKAGKYKVEEMQQDERVIKALQQISERFHSYIGALTGYHNIWPLLASGVLREHLGVDDAKLTAAAEDVLSTVRTRMTKGRQNTPNSGKPIKQLLEILADNTRKHAGPLYQEALKDPPENYLHSPATPQDIADLEKRLEMPCPLPDDYKEFLLASNGLEETYNGILLTAPFLRAQDVAISTEYPADVDPPLPLQLTGDSTGTFQLASEYGNDLWPSAQTFIQVGSEFEIKYLFVHPEDTRAAVQTYLKALESDKVSDVTKQETKRAIEDLYGSIEEFKELEWVLMDTVDHLPNPVGTFRGWLEGAVRESGWGEGRDRSGGGGLAYECKAKRVKRE